MLDDRDPTLNLPVELIPKTTWDVNVRTILDGRPDLWEMLRQDAIMRGQYRCKFCHRAIGNSTNKPHFHAHERWLWEETSEGPLQNLYDIVAICPRCHLSCHLGFAQKQGRFAEAVEYMSSVNQMDRDQTRRYVDAVFFEWQLRSEIAWEVRIDWALDRLEYLKELANSNTPFYEWKGGP